MHTRFLSWFVAGAFALLPGVAHAGDILFVSDVNSDNNIPTALMADDHTVTVVINDYVGGSNTRLKEDLSEFDAVYWSATGGGFGSTHTDPLVFTNLTDYVMDGGRVFVTGYDSIASPTDSMLIAFLGGTSSSDGGRPNAIITEENSLNTGVVDLGGVTPTGFSGDQDTLTGAGPDVVVVCSSATAGGASWLIRTLGDGEIAYVSNGDSGTTSAAASWLNTTAGGAGAYNAALRNFAFAADAGSREEGAPLVEFDSERAAEEGAEIAISVSVVDEEGDTVSWSWDLDGDETYGEMEDEESVTIPAGTTDGPSSIRIGVQAMDSGGRTNTRIRTIRIQNVDPVITSEPSTFASVGAAYLYDIEAEDPGGDADPLTYVLVRGPDRMVVSDEGRVSWTPNESEVTMAGETLMVEIQVADDDEGMATQVWTMTVSPNRAPGPPSPVYPVGTPIDDDMPRLVTANASDPDFDDLQYFFELDTVDTYDSPDLRQSGAIDQQDGITPWQLDAPLERGRAYFWRVRAFDGIVESEWREATFRVVAGEPPMTVDAGPGGGTDAGMVGGVDAGPGRGGGGGCTVTPNPAPATGTAILLAMVALVLARRRR